MTHHFRHSPRRSARVSAFAVALAVAALASPIRAQELMHGFVDPCTVDNVQEMTTVCEMCAVPASDPAACSNRLGKRGYEKKCRTVGDHSGYSEAWCIAQDRALAARTAPVSPAPPRVNHLKEILLLGVPLLLGAFLLIQRARSRRVGQK